MKHEFHPRPGRVLRNAFAATAVTFATLSSAFAGDYNTGLQTFLSAPTSFVAVAEGAPGPVTFASMAGDTLAVQFLIPSHSGDTFGEFVGKADEQGAFVGNGVLIMANGSGRAGPVTLNFEDDGTIVATTKNGTGKSGFMPAAMFHGY